MQTEGVWGAAFRKGITAARTNVVPGICLQAAALAVLLAYFYIPVVNQFFAKIQVIKSEIGLISVVISTAFFGAFLPFIIQRCGQTKFHDPWRRLPAILLFWGYKGIEIEYLYRLQAWVFGEDNQFWTLVCKVVVDQFVYCVLISVPVMAAFYLWKDSDFKIAPTVQGLKNHFIAQRALPLLLSNLGVWLPAVVIIYCLPTPLQLPMQNLILCLFVLLISVLSKQSTGTQPTT